MGADVAVQCATTGNCVVSSVTATGFELLQRLGLGERQVELGGAGAEMRKDASDELIRELDDLGAVRGGQVVVLGSAYSGHGRQKRG